MINEIAIFFAILSWLLSGVILILLQRKVVIYHKDTKQIIAIVKPLLYTKQVIHKDLDLIVTIDEVKLTGQDGKVYYK